MLPNGKPANLDGANPESVASAANEMYEKVRSKMQRETKTHNR